MQHVDVVDCINYSCKEKWCPSLNSWPRTTSSGWQTFL